MIRIITIICLMMTAHLSLAGEDLLSDSIADVVQNSGIVNTPSASLYSKISQDPNMIYIGILLLLGLCFTLVLRSSSAAMAGEEQEDDDYIKDPIRYNALAKIAPALRAGSFLFYGFAVGYVCYIGILGSSSYGHVMEWLNLIIRWAHVVAGVMWIGASFYFIFLENNLNRKDGLRDELAGNLWAVHGGGFYYVEKYKIAPGQLPKKLHWFKYEAYFTWLTGFMLLWVVYYMNASAFLIDPSVMDLTPKLAISIGIGSLILGWFVYDAMCRSRLKDRPLGFVIVGLICFIGMAYFYTHVFSARAAFIHMGALIGSIMVGNVFFNIIPAQKEMVRCAVAGLPLDPLLGMTAGLRSLHNNYFTLPVIFIMISNHFPSTFGHELNWLILTVITVASATIKHYWNLIERGEKRTYLLIFGIVGLLSLALVTSPFIEDEIEDSTPVAFSEVQAIIDARCIQCHSAYPTDDTWKTAPNGVMYDTPEQIKVMVDKIMTRAVRTKSMPQGNKTNMTIEERQVLKRWILQGAHISAE